LILFAYIIGSIPTGYWVGLVIKKIDIRTVGSKNIGATNVFRTLGPVYGIIVLIIDILKGILPVSVARLYITPDMELIWILAGMATICGHTWTIFLKFKGGKGVATSLGVFLGLTPIPVLIIIPGFIVIVGITRYVSLGSIISSVCLPPLVWIFEKSILLTVFSGLIAILIVVRHASNIKRLIKGEENRIW
jgi:glycerol-3-phosphate acyltransferase PlsY